jgi:hypothetical protein
MKYFDEIKRCLFEIYGHDKLHIYECTQYLDDCIKCHIPKSKRKKYDIVISVQDGYAVVFNNMIRKKNEKYTEYFSCSKVSWSELKEKDIYVKDYYGNIDNKYPHKCLAMSLDALYENRYEIYDLLKFSVDDTDIPYNLKQELENKYVRGTVTSTRKERDARFRKLVLENYNYQCAICRCSEVELLQAAHINPVAINGTDDLNNGICLCANHHLMFDRNLIKIDFDSGRIVVIKKSIENMSWYKEFNEKYSGIILKKNK